MGCWRGFVTTCISDTSTYPLFLFNTPLLTLKVHIMDPGCLYYGVQPVGVPGAPDRRDGRGACQERAEHR